MNKEVKTKSNILEHVTFYYQFYRNTCYHFEFNTNLNKIKYPKKYPNSNFNTNYLEKNHIVNLIYILKYYFNTKFLIYS